ncbi:MAG: hypothetical protein ACOC29_03795 [Candidatus Sumerlaeota bacterium]
MPRPSHRFFKILLLFLGIASVLAGCSRYQSQSDDENIPVRGTALGVARLEADIPNEEFGFFQRLMGQSPPEPYWWERHLEIVVDESMPSGATSHVEALVLARARARDKAVQKLLIRVAELPGYKGGLTVGEEFADNAPLRVRVAGIVKEHTVVVRDSTLDDGDKYRILVRLPLWRVSQALYATPGDGWNFNKQKASTPAEEHALEQARIKAESDAREKIDDYTIGNRRMGEMIRDNRLLWNTLRDVLANAEIVEKRFPEPGACEVTIEVDLAPLNEAAIAQSGGRR